MTSQSQLGKSISEDLDGRVHRIAGSRPTARAQSLHSTSWTRRRQPASPRRCSRWRVARRTSPCDAPVRAAPKTLDPISLSSNRIAISHARLALTCLPSVKPSVGNIWLLVVAGDLRSQTCAEDMSSSSHWA